ncbi:CHAT domain-containing protein [Suillus fuscotomentosus]|uniref:CHAT domain-containing protein n=1 Tax=Suillus fuscotomentosus TaxID=1912939 RepID=A0AAD4DNQ9_9AGAM|nr:CHAT domain-containing protein [Suillus fuscotomentosus]KAG1886812.1 CHAT domain-containing protein [Suillus fuscotomentosus]
MSRFVPGHFSDCPPCSEEGLSHPKCPQDTGQKNLVLSEILQVFVIKYAPDPPDDIVQALGEEPGQLEQPQDLGDTNLVISKVLLQITANNSLLDQLHDTLPASGEESSHPEHTQDPGQIHFSGVQQVVISFPGDNIPAGFHAVVKADSAEYQTSNQSVHVDQAVVEWHEHILLSACMPHLNWIQWSVTENSSVHSRSQSENYWIAAKGLIMLTSITAIMFQPKQEDIVSACTSLFMMVEQRLSDQNDGGVLCSLTTATSRDMDGLAVRTDSGHRLLARYRRMQNSTDLDQSISHFEWASDLCPVDHPYHPATLFNLAMTKFISCLANGRYLDLNIPISLFQDTLDLRSAGHSDRPMTQLHLAISLLSRFVRRGFQTDADMAEELLSDVLDACHPDSHIYRAALIAIETSAMHRSMDANDLQQEGPATSILPLSPNQLAHRAERCLQRDEPRDLDEVISLHCDALVYFKTGHAYRGQLLGNLAAIALQREVLALRPVSHTDRSKSLNNLANQLSSRFDRRGDNEDLDEAIALQREVLALSSVGHTDRSSSLNNLANQLSFCFKHRGNDKALDGTGGGKDTESLNGAMHYFKEAVNVVSGGLLSRLRTSLLWVHRADQHRHHTQLEAYMTSMQLLDAYMSNAAAVSSRHNIIKDFPSTLAVDAALCALCSGDVCRAVELLEQGRTIIWTQMTRLCTPLDSLQTHGDHAVALMKRFRDLSSLLDKPPVSHAEGTPIVNTEAEETWYRHLVKEWNEAVEEIWKIEGFSRFLLPPLFSDLQNAAREGPIIILITSELSCHAIIILHKQPPTDIQLPTDVWKLVQLVNALQKAVRKEADPNGNQMALTKALRELWDNVVCPVVENLEGFAKRGSRIWWCPTSLFNFLPLHAAGEYRPKGKSVSQQYISSYMPSLTALIKACASHVKSLSVLFAAIGQDCPAGAESTLYAVEPELELVQRLLPPPPIILFSKITSIEATRSRALHALQDNTWLHLACHGTQKIVKPFKSAFLMRDKPLSLLDITQMDLSRHEFAFLSACQTAVSVPTTPDEVIYLAAGLQFAGVNSIVGTLWKVTDNTVQHLVEAFYKNMHGDGPMNSKRAAWALHQAVQSLACDKNIPIPLDQRIVFMHIGI